jgi:hypothetical protein
LDEGGSTLIFGHDDSANTLSWLAAFAGGGIGEWTFPATDGKWIPISLIYDKSLPGNDPQVRVNFLNVDNLTDANPPGGTASVPNGYCVGNDSEQSSGWDGKIAHLQVFNRILPASERDACLQAPGSITNGLRLWLPMTNANDTNDCSGNGSHGTPTDLTTDITGPMLTDQPGVLPGVKILNAGTTFITQHEIPRFFNGISYPAGQLRGQGPQSVVSGTQDTQYQTPPAIVLTEDANIGTIAFWQTGNTGATAPAVLQPELSNLTIIGYSTDGWVTAGDVDDNPHIYNINDPDLYKGYYAYGSGGLIDKVTVMGIPGTGIEVGRPPDANRTGAQLPHDRFKWNISRVNCHRLFRGINNHAVDSHLHDCEVWAFRDYGIRLDASVQFARLHTFGGGVIGTGEKVGAGIWIDGNTNQGGPIYVENSPIGLLVEGNFKIPSRFFCKSA